jgi:CDP-diacylglycerol--glycerol-3-phosphate 3-phosphatidyltransferase
MFFYAGMVIFGAGIFDMVDGRVARRNNQVTVFGSFFDSVIDRYSDVVLFFGLLVFYARGNRFFYVVLAGFVMITSLMVSYTRARSEALIGSCKVGFMERPERVVLIILGALFERWGVMAPALWVLAVLSTITVIHRISYTYTMAKTLTLDAPSGAARTVPIRPAGSPGPVSSTASVSGAEHELISAPNAPRA